MRYIHYSVVNIYSDHPLRGNPVAVVPHTLDLHETEMQDMAREFNLSCTVFISSAKDGSSLARLRFFTPQRERMFSGKGTLAAWKAYFDGGHVDIPVALADGLINDSAGDLSFASQSWDAVTPVTVRRDNDQVADVTVQLPEATAELTISDPAQVAAALGAEKAVLDGMDTNPQVISVGGAKLVVPVKTLADLESLKPSAHSIQRSLQLPEIEGIYAFAIETLAGDSPVRARGFYPATGVAEDAASGSGAACLVAYLKVNGLLESPDQNRLRISQGSPEFGGLISAAWDATADNPAVSISGPVTISRTGTFVLP